VVIIKIIVVKINEYPRSWRERLELQPRCITENERCGKQGKLIAGNLM
jgi:hypothetical protein